MAGTDGIVNQVVQISQQITGIGTVYGYNPLTAELNDGPAAWVYVDHVEENRRGYGGLKSGKKLVKHRVSMTVHQVSSQNDQDETMWRQFLDNIRSTWRANQTWANTNGTVERFGEDIEIEVTDPFLNGDMVQFFATVTSYAWEEITA